MSATLRFYWFLDTYGRHAVLILLVLGFSLVGAGIFVYMNPSTTTVSEQQNVQQVGTSILTSAVVINNTTLYEPGKRLVNQPVYVLEATPNLTYHVQTRVPEGQAVRVTHQLTFRLAAARDGNVFWESERRILEESLVVEDGQAVSSASLNMSAVGAEVRQRRDQVGAIDEFTSEVVLNVTYDTGSYQGQLTGSTPVVFSAGAFWVEGDIARSQTHGETVTREVPDEPDMGTTMALAILGTLIVLGAAALEVLRRRDIDRAELEMQLALDRFDDWISEGQIVTDADRKYVMVSSIQDLVDIAIDSEKRVIHDPEFDIYAVVDDDIVYYFATGPHRIDDWLTM